MESAIRKVRDMETDKRQWIEAFLGRQLTENQQVIVHVIDVGVEPDLERRQVSLTEATKIAGQGRANTAATGATEQEVDAAIEEAVRLSRQQKS